MVDHPPPADVTANSFAVTENLRAGLELLWRAYELAQDAKAALWDFAVERTLLHEVGLTVTELRWLVAKGFTEHGQETSFYGDAHRSFRFSRGLSFEQNTCFVLTALGASLAKRVVTEYCPATQCPSSLVDAKVAGLETPISPHGNGDSTNGVQSQMVPHWDLNRRELFFADRIVKRFRVPAYNQEIVLSAFEEEGWPEQIDDPLPINGETPPAIRLHSTINRLNGGQENLLVRFRGNGKGNGVRWEKRQLFTGDRRRHEQV